MRERSIARGSAELARARSESRGYFAAVAIFSAFVNFLALTGPLFMLQVYDRVLGGRSVETLGVLVALVIFLFAIMGVLDLVRARVMARVAARFQARLEARVFDAALRRSTETGSGAAADPAAAAALRDLEAVQRFLSSPILLALFDLPFAPFFLLAVYLFHPWLGGLAVVGGAVLVVTALLNQQMTQLPLKTAHGAALGAERLADQLREEAEMIEALGMRGAGFRRWRRARAQALAQSISASDTGSSFSVFTRTFRLFLQSAMLAMGAWLVLRGELSAGVMIASSILMGRALAPVEQIVGGWPMVARAREGWQRLAGLLGRTPPAEAPMALPRPRARLEVHQVSIVPPGQSVATLRLLSFRLDPGQALGVIGPSGAGKTTLARALCGVWRPAGGQIRLDGATLEQYAPDVLGGLIGYLPQRVTLFEGTIAENIARLTENADPAAVVAAAKRADAHQMILALPQGYGTRVSAGGGQLSGGQIQRIGLARALFGDPVLLVLDEPNSNLDNDGTLALNAAIRSVKAAGGGVLIMAHRPAAIAECDLLLVLDGGMRRAFGPRDEVMRAMLQNAEQIANAPGVGGAI
jgi:ATP-binding cassette, subfamily C, bacterial